MIFMDDMIVMAHSKEYLKHNNNNIATQLVQMLVFSGVSCQEQTQSISYLGPTLNPSAITISLPWKKATHTQQYCQWTLQ